MSPARHPDPARAEAEDRALRRLGAALAAGIDLPETVPLALGEVKDLLGFDDAAVLVLDEARRSLRIFAATRLLGPADTEIRIDLPQPQSLSAAAIRRGDTLLVEDTSAGSYLFDARLNQLGYRAHLAHPLRRRGELVGTLNLARRAPGPFPPFDRAFLEEVAGTVAIAVHNSLLFERLRSSERLYASLVESSRDLIFELDRAGNLTFVNRPAAALSGRPPAELVGRPWSDLLHPEDAGPDLLAPLRDGRAEELSLDLRLRAADGRTILTSQRIAPIRDEHGELKGFQGVARDITAEREAARAMRLHHELVEALDDYVFMADTSGRLLAMNRKARLDLGWDLNEMGERSIWDLHPPEDKARVERERWRIVETGASSFEVRLLSKSGRTIPTRAHMTYSPESGTFQGVYRDISEEGLMHERMLQVEKLRALGEMASGVAHTFNNLLAVIGTTVQVARRLTREEALLRELGAIEQAVYDGGAAVRRIQDFTRQRPAELHADLALEDILGEAVRVATQRARLRPGPTVRIGLDVEPGLKLRGSEGELRDVFLNLLFNSLDAMPDGGPIAVRATRRDGLVAVEVVDCGRGMTPEVRSRIFTPFFSTKGERGSGLGLATALNVVSQHGGTIEVDSQPGRGTTMRVLLPLSSAAPRRPRAPARVLIAAAEPLLRTQLARAIAAEGHLVEAVSATETARQLLEGETFDCAFVALDLAPSGLEVIDRAKARGAGAVLLCGWGAEVSEETVREHGVDALLRTPFPLEAALNLVTRFGQRRGSGESERPQPDAPPDGQAG